MQQAMVSCFGAGFGNAVASSDAVTHELDNAAGPLVHVRQRPINSFVYGPQSQHLVVNADDAGEPSEE